MKIQDRVLSHLLDSPATATSEKIKNITMLFVMNVAWLMVVIKFLGWIWPEMYSVIGSQDLILQFFFAPEPPFRHEFFMACVAAPLWEELAFRYVPFTFAKNLGRQYLLPTLALTTILFGWGHGEGTISLLIQGFGGLFMAYAYLKNGYSYWSSVALHFMWNFFCITILNG